MRPPGLSKRHGAVEHLGLFFHALLKCARPHAPFGVRIAPPSAGAGAGRVDQHQVDAAGKIVELAADRFRRAHLDIARARALEPRVDRRQTALVVVGGIELALVLHHRGQRQGLAPRPGTEIDHLLAGRGAREEGGELRAFVLHLDHAFEEGRLGMDRRALGIGRQADAQAPRATSAWARGSGPRASPRPCRARPSMC